MRWLYHLAIRFYVWGIQLAALWMPKARLWVQGRRLQRQRMKTLTFPQNRQRVWMHCASAGEYEQGRPVLEAIRKHDPHSFLIVTFFSPSGYESRKTDALPDCVCYLPADLPGKAQDFIDKIRPHLAIFVKYEFWWGYIHALQQRHIPSILISARFKHQSFFYRLYMPFFVRWLKGFSHIFVQDAASALWLKQHGVHRVEVSGDTRFDRVVQIAARWQPDRVMESFLQGRKAIVAGSTWPEDEQLWCDYAVRFGLQHPLIVVPHEIQHRRIEQLLASWPGSAVRYSSWEPTADKHSDSCSLLVVDKMGLLSRLYAYGWLAYVGGGFGAGIHNVLEAAVYGIPVVFGPRYGSFLEARDLVQQGAAFSVKDIHTLARTMHALASTDLDAVGATARRYVQAHAGATGKILNYLTENRFLTTS